MIHTLAALRLMQILSDSQSMWCASKKHTRPNPTVQTFWAFESECSANHKAFLNLKLKAFDPSYFLNQACGAGRQAAGRARTAIVWCAHIMAASRRLSLHFCNRTATIIRCMACALRRREPPRPGSKNKMGQYFILTEHFIRSGLECQNRLSSCAAFQSWFQSMPQNKLFMYSE